MDLRSFLVLLLLSSGAAAWCIDDDFAEMGKEREEDRSSHECRACKAVTVDKEANCPADGYECDKDFKLAPNAISSDDRCVCSQIKCADPKTVLYVGGAPVRKIHCRNLTWTTLAGSPVSSVICAKKLPVVVCGSCAISPNDGYENSPLVEPFARKTPDADHPCEWGQCTEGAFASNPSVGPVIHRESVWFSCGADGFWKMMNPDNTYSKVNYNRLQCIKRRCVELGYASAPAPFCGTQYRCYSPHRADVNEPDAEMRMTCDTPNALRFTETPNQVRAPKCFLGQWENEAAVVPDATKVLCITCPEVDVNNADTVIQPDISNGHVTCPNKKLYIELQICINLSFCAWTPSIQVTTIFCNGQFIWDTTGGKLNNFVSLKDAIQQGIKWRALCKN